MPRIYILGFRRRARTKSLLSAAVAVAVGRSVDGRSHRAFYGGNLSDTAAAAGRSRLIGLPAGRPPARVNSLFESTFHTSAAVVGDGDAAAAVN